MRGSSSIIKNLIDFSFSLVFHWLTGMVSQKESHSVLQLLNLPLCGAYSYSQNS